MHYSHMARLLSLGYWVGLKLLSLPNDKYMQIKREKKQSGYARLHMHMHGYRSIRPSIEIVYMLNMHYRINKPPSHGLCGIRCISTV